MQSERTSEKAPIAPIQMSQSTTKEDYQPNHTVRKTRMILLILLGIHMVLAWLYLIERIIYLIKYCYLFDDTRDVAASFIGYLTFGAILILYLTLYIVVVFKCCRIAILVFSWLGILELMCMMALVIFAIIGIVNFSTVLHYIRDGLVFSVIFLIIALFTFTFTTLTVIVSLTLAKSIKIQNNYQSM